MKALRALRLEAGALWILMLVFMAGALNAAGWLQFGQTLSHMTGNLTKVGLSLSGQGAESFALLAMDLLSFFLGATLSGYSFPQHRVGLWQRSGLVLMGSGALLMLSEFLPFPENARMGALAFVLGMQNGLALRYRGILTRTTHMTGHLTDCGAALGRMVQARSWRGENLRLFLFHFLCLAFFLLGVIFTALSLRWLDKWLSLDAIELAALCYLLAGAGTFGRGVWYRLGEG
ncbi:MAG: YoaK family protein [Christensenellales bacterium]